MESNFTLKCYELLGRVPKGKVVTYKEIARALGSKASRAVGSAMKKNKFPLEVKCFKVVRSDGSIGEYSYGGVGRKVKLLRAEGIEVVGGKVDLGKYSHKF